MANNKSIDNLKNGVKTQFKTGEDAAEKGRKGGIASGKAKREKKAMKDALEIALNMPIKKGRIKGLEDIKNFKEIAGENVTVQEAIVAVMLQKALKGDIKAAEFVRDSSGQRPDDKMKLEMNVPVLFSGESDLED